MDCLIGRLKEILHKYESLYLFLVWFCGKCKRIVRLPRTLSNRKRGEYLFNIIVAKYGCDKKYYFTMSHLGEMVAGLYYVGADQDRTNIVVISFKTIKPILRLYEDSGITFHIIDSGYDSECLFEYAMKKNSPLCSFTTATLRAKHPFLFYRQNFFKSYREYLVGYSMMNATPLSPIFTPEDSFSVDSLDFCITDKTVFICPYSNSRISPDMTRFFQAFVDCFTADGYECVCLLGAPNHDGLEKCHNVFLKFNDLGWLMQQGGALVAYRSGLCDVLLFANAPMVCLYDKKMDYALRGYRLDEDEPLHVNPRVTEVHCDFKSDDAVDVVKEAVLKGLRKSDGDCDQ